MEPVVYCGYTVFDGQYYFTSNSQMYEILRNIWKR